MSKNRNKDLVPASSSAQFPELPAEREGFFKQGFDKLGRPYEKKLDSNGLFTKKELLLDGSEKMTLKRKK